MKKRHLIPLALLLLLAIATPRGVDAQVLYGSLTGNVTDQTGAVVNGAKAEARNIATGVSTIISADQRGSYLFSNLQVGVYKVTITAQGFKALTQENVRIDANTTRRLDAQMEVGDVTATVQVSADTPTLQTERADVNITQSARQVNNLPLFGSVGRNYQTLIQLIPGTSRSQGFVGNGSGEENSAAGNPQRSISYNVNGVSRLQNNTRIDGSSVIYPWLPTNTVYVPPAESIQEVNIVTNAFDAEQGLAGGAAVNVTIKTGGNDFHGVGWGYDTNSAFLSRRYFQPAKTRIATSTTPTSASSREPRGRTSRASGVSARVSLSDRRRLLLNVVGGVALDCGGAHPGFVNGACSGRLCLLRTSGCSSALKG